MIKEEELKEIKGGAVSVGTIINAVVKAISLALELGRGLGSAIRRKKMEENVHIKRQYASFFFCKMFVKK